MKIKLLLKFYFCADSLERAFGGLITKTACAFGEEGREAAERICGLIGEKIKLGGLWNYLDGVISGLTDADKRALENYALLRGGTDESVKKEMRRAAAKFVRRARRAETFSEEMSIVKKYGCLLSAEG